MKNGADEHDSRLVPKIKFEGTESNNHYNVGDIIDSRSIYSRIEWEKTHYKLNYKYLAKYFIFNHYKFEDDRLNARNGTNEDVAELEKVFKKLNCKKGEKTFQDLSAKEVTQELEKAAKGDYRDYAAVIVVVLSHGEEGILYAKDKHYDLKKLWGPFLSQNASKDLIGKPKIFIIQACQGTTPDPGVERTETDAKIDTTRNVNIPLYADFLFLFSSPPGNCAFRSSTGSWMIQTLCQGLRDHHDDLDLQSIVLLVKNYIACHKESYSPENAQYNKKKQMPYEASTFTKKFYLTETCLKKYSTWTDEPTLIQTSPKFLTAEEKPRKMSRDGPAPLQTIYDKTNATESNMVQEVHKIIGNGHEQNSMFILGMALMAGIFLSVFLAVASARMLTN